jgi:DNA polymerase-3 subunit delta'
MHFPWTHSQWLQLVRRVTEKRLPHAMLFCGIEGLGKYEIAFEFSRALLCDQPDDNYIACGRCRSCTQFAASTHPDFHLVAPDEDGKPVKVDQIRELIQQFELVSHHGGYRVAIINPADAMNLAAANSLLKSLEEPPENTLIILVSANVPALPATILSRCQRINFDAPGLDMALSWLNKHHPEYTGKEQALLAMASGAPLKALSTADSEEIGLRDEIFAAFMSIANGSGDVLSNNSQWLKAGVATPIKWVYSWVSDLIKLKCRLGQAIINHDKLADLQNMAQQVELDGLYQYLDKLLDILKKQHAPLNAQMILDDLLIDWQSITTTSQQA